MENALYLPLTDEILSIEKRILELKKRILVNEIKLTRPDAKYSTR